MGSLSGSRTEKCSAGLCEITRMGTVYRGCCAYAVRGVFCRDYRIWRFYLQVWIGRFKDPQWEQV